MYRMELIIEIFLKGPKSNSEDASQDGTTWSRQEDAMLLESMKKNYSKDTFRIVSEKLKTRSVQDVSQL